MATTWRCVIHVRRAPELSGPCCILLYQNPSHTVGPGAWQAQQAQQQNGTALERRAAMALTRLGAVRRSGFRASRRRRRACGWWTAAAPACTSCPAWASTWARQTRPSTSTSRPFCGPSRCRPLHPTPSRICIVATVCLRMHTRLRARQSAPSIDELCEVYAEIYPTLLMHVEVSYAAGDLGPSYQPGMRGFVASTCVRQVAGEPTGDMSSDCMSLISAGPFHSWLNLHPRKAFV